MSKYHLALFEAYTYYRIEGLRHMAEAVGFLITDEINSGRLVLSE